MAEPTPILDEALLDAYALIFARIALDRVMASPESEQPAAELGATGMTIECATASRAP